MPHETVTLASQSLVVDGPVRPASAGDWTAGLKIGKATYDERLHAWWLVLDDFSGGMGYRELDIREALGTVWEDTDGVDLRRAGHVTLPPVQDKGDLTDDPTKYDYTARVPTRPTCGSSVGGTPAHYLGLGNAIYRTVDDGDTLTRVKAIGNNAYMISTILNFAAKPDGAAKLYAFPEGTSGAARYQVSTDPENTWTDGGTGTQKVIEDAIVWESDKRYIIGTCPIAQIIFSTDGATWNIDAAADGEPLWRAGYGRVMFIGVFMAPWGESAVHFLAQNDQGHISLFALDFHARKAVEIPISKTDLICGTVWQNYIVVSDGDNVYLWDGATVRNISWSRRGALPSMFQNGLIWNLVGGGDYLYAILESAPTVTKLIVYNGAGWSALNSGSTAYSSMILGYLTRFIPRIVGSQRRLVTLGAEKFASDATDFKRIHWTLPQNSDTPSVDLDNFSDGPLSFVTGWIDGGFREISGALYRLYIDGYNIGSDEKVTVAYGLDNDETTWHTDLEDSGVFTAAGQSKDFPGSGAGKEFRTVRFRVTLDRGSTTTKSPELKALVLLYDKKPDFRSSWTLRIDVSQMKASKTQVGGNDATVLNVWEKLISIWNTKTLVVLNVPNIDTSVYVKMTDMIGTFDDFRDAAEGQGFVDITVVEPI